MRQKCTVLPFPVPCSFCSARLQSSVCHMTFPAPATWQAVLLLSAAVEDVIPCQSRSNFLYSSDHPQQQQHFTSQCLVPFHSTRRTATSDDLRKICPAEHVKYYDASGHPLTVSTKNTQGIQILLLFFCGHAERMARGLPHKDVPSQRGGEVID